MSEHDSELDRWEQSAVDFVTAYQRIPAERRTESIDGGWSARQVLQHLLEDEILFSTRMRAAIADPGSTILPFDAERYQASLAYVRVPDEVLLSALLALHTVNVELLRATPIAVWTQTVVHPEAGDQSVEQISTMFGDHIADHLNDLQNARLDGARR
jgi:hypothetical protein